MSSQFVECQCWSRDVNCVSCCCNFTVAHAFFHSKCLHCLCLADFNSCAVNCTCCCRVSAIQSVVNCGTFCCASDYNTLSCCIFTACWCKCRCSNRLHRSLVNCNICSQSNAELWVVEATDNADYIDSVTFGNS